MTRSPGRRSGTRWWIGPCRSGKVMRAVAGFDATLSAPKSLSVWWALTGDDGLAECHDVAVNAVVDYIERFGSTTRIRSNGRRLHPDTQGLTVAAFRQTTSRLDDPQLHTHVVISAKVQTDDGRWLALDARVVEAAPAGVRRAVSVGAARRAHPPLRGRVRLRSSTGRPRSPACRTSCWSSSPNAPPRSTRALQTEAGRVLPPARAVTRHQRVRAALGTPSGRGHPRSQDRQRCRRSAVTVAGRGRRPSASPPTR